MCNDGWATCAMRGGLHTMMGGLHTCANVCAMMGGLHVQ